ncbi:MAG: ribosome maturation factor RimP [Rhodospirillales bacterium]|nr:ribosome maturation factor RimP [Rhodospirillales bacterium]
MSLASRIEDLISPTIEELGFEIVRVELLGEMNPCLQIMADRLDQTAMNVDDCAKISRAVSAIMDVEDPITNAYTLEVSSPGLDRPLVKLAHFERFKGNEIRLEKRGASDDQRRFRGQLLGVDGDYVKLLIKGEEIQIPFADILKAKMVVTDELIAAAKEGTG